MTVTVTASASAQEPEADPTSLIVRLLDVVGLPVTRAARKTLAHAVLGLVPSLLGLLLVPLAACGGILCVTRLGPPFLSAVLIGARGLNTVHRALLRRLLRTDIPAPPSTAPRRIVSDGNAWRGAGFSVAAAPVSVVHFVFQLPVRLYALAAVSYPVWFHAVRQDGHRGIGLPGDIPLDTLPRALALSAAGLLLLAGAGWTGRRLTALVVVLAHVLLTPAHREDRIRDLEETRALAVRDSAATLRRIERDLHDGAQARLIAVAMTLTRARDALDPDRSERTDVAKARDLVDHSLTNARTAIGELRDLVRGIHPPVLDSGLDVALASLASDLESATMRVRVRTELPARPPEAIETIAYFCVSELLTNAARHASAGTVDVAVRTDGEGGLTLTVRDDGTGGARLSPRRVPGGGGTGLAGLAERVRTIDGALSLDSPPGGPTTATVRLPALQHPRDPACAS